MMWSRTRSPQWRRSCLPEFALRIAGMGSRSFKPPTEPVVALTEAKQRAGDREIRRGESVKGFGDRRMCASLMAVSKAEPRWPGRQNSAIARPQLDRDGQIVGARDLAHINSDMGSSVSPDADRHQLYLLRLPRSEPTAPDTDRMSPPVTAQGDGRPSIYLGQRSRPESLIDHPSRTTRRCTEPSSFRGTDTGLAATSTPSSSAVATPRCTPCGFSTMIS